MTVAQRKALRALLLNETGKLHHGDAIGADAEAPIAAAEATKLRIAEAMRLQSRP
jgi:hypothetical protein